VDLDKCNVSYPAGHATSEKLLPTQQAICIFHLPGFIIRAENSTIEQKPGTEAENCANQVP
jgi:hypothetical protein